VPSRGFRGCLVFWRNLQDVPVTIGGATIPAADALYAGEIGANVEGAFQINVLVPPGLPSGNDAVTVTIGGVNTQAGVTVAIK
jgi:uncharacterized protein (TIGR03437 family)